MKKKKEDKYIGYGIIVLIVLGFLSTLHTVFTYLFLFAIVIFALYGIFWIIRLIFFRGGAFFPFAKGFGVHTIER